MRREQHLARLHSLSSLCAAFSPPFYFHRLCLALSNLHLFIRRSFFAGQIDFLFARHVIYDAREDAWCMRACIPRTCLQALLMFLNLSLLPHHIGRCVPSAKLVYVRRIQPTVLLVQTFFLMSAICAHPASNQILPYLCVCVNKWAGWGKEGDFSCASPLLDVKVSNIFCLACGVLQAIQGGILLQLLPTPTCTKQAVLGIHQVSSTLLPIHRELIFNKVISWEKLSV